jgi:hypothetical protein
MEMSGVKQRGLNQTFERMKVKGKLVRGENRRCNRRNGLNARQELDSYVIGECRRSVDYVKSMCEDDSVV